MHLRHDLRAVLRGFGRAPGPPIAVVLTLGLALGANSAAFSLIDRVAMRPLPVEKPHEIVVVNAWRLPYRLPSVMTGDGRLRGMPYPLFLSLRSGLTRSFSAMGAYRFVRLTVSAEPAAVEIIGHAVTADYFTVLGLHASLGRTLLSADDRERDGAAVAVLNHGFWLRQYGGDRTIVGRTIRLNNLPFTVVGVLAAGYSGMTAGQSPDVLVPVAMSGRLLPLRRPFPFNAWDGPTYSVYMVIARLAPGVSREAAERELRVCYQRLFDQVIREHGVTLTARDEEVFRTHPPELISAGTVGSAQAALQRNLEVPLKLLFAMATLVLLVAAGNVANLMAAAGARRGYEMAVSLALGARRWDLLRPRLLEAVALSTVSGGAALLLARWAGDLLPSLLGMGQELGGISTRPDARVVAFTAGMSLLTALVIWLASALIVTRRAALPTLVAGRADATGTRPGVVLRRSVVIAQVSLSLALVCTAALLGRSLANALTVDPGFDAERVVGFSVNARAVGYDGDRLERYERSLVERARGLPGVSDVAVSSIMPLSGSTAATEVSGPRQQAGRGAMQYADVMQVSPSFFATLGLDVIAGRPFDDRDVSGAPRVAIVNETCARLLVDGPDIIGQMIGYPGAPATLQIIGVARDARTRFKAAPPPTLFLPRAQTTGAGSITILLRVARPGAVSATAVSEIVQRLDSAVAMSAVSSLDRLAREALFRDRMLAGLSLVFASLAGLLAAIGLASVSSINVTRRTREIGIRFALGASRRSVEWLVFREAVALLSAGVAIGVALFLSGNRVLRSMLFEISPNDPATIGAVIAAVVAIGILSALLPARRAAAIDPALTLRCE